MNQKHSPGKELKMADLTAVFGILILLGLSYPCLLAAWRILFAGGVERARLRIERTPGRCVWMGAAAALLSLAAILILLNLPFGPAKFLGWVLTAGLLGFASLGGAGWAALAGQRLLGPMASPTLSLIVGALVSELAAVFPLIGWLIFLPYTLLVTLGAALFAALRWMPSVARQAGPALYAVEPVQSPAVPDGQS
jgi:hypothetical protein